MNLLKEKIILTYFCSFFCVAVLYYFSTNVSAKLWNLQSKRWYNPCTQDTGLSNFFFYLLSFFIPSLSTCVVIHWVSTCAAVSTCIFCVLSKLFLFVVFEWFKLLFWHSSFSFGTRRFFKFCFQSAFSFNQWLFSLTTVISLTGTVHSS